MAIATFGTKTFDVSRNKIYTPDGIAFSQSLNTESQDVEGGKPSTYIKGVNLIPLSFTVDLNARFVDVNSEIDWWNNKMLSKVPDVFTLGGKVISRYKFLLKSVAVSDITIGKKGVYLKAKIDLQFEEFVSLGYKTTDGTTTTSTTSASTKKSTSKKSASSAVHVMSPAAIKAIEEATKKR